MVARPPNHHLASPSSLPTAKVRLRASPSASTTTPLGARSSVYAMVLLLSLHNAVQGILTEYEPPVKVKCTIMCNNFFHGTQIRDEAQGRAHGGDPPEDHRGRRRAARDRRPRADHRERRGREGGGAEA